MPLTSQGWSASVKQGVFRGRGIHVLRQKLTKGGVSPPHSRRTHPGLRMLLAPIDPGLNARIGGDRLKDAH